MISKISKYVAYAIGVLGLVLYLLFIGGFISADTLFSSSMVLFWVLFGAAVALMLVFLVKEFFSPGIIKGTVGGIVGLAILVGISYGISDADPVGTQYSGEIAKQVGTGLWTLYLLFIVSLLVIGYTEIKKLLR